MDWIHWTESQLRFYAARDQRREDILLELKALDSDTGVKSVTLDGMPREKGFPSSVVETVVIYTEEARESLLKKLEWLEEDIRTIQTALDLLSEMEYKVLYLAYLRCDFNYDSTIAEILGIPLKQFWRIKITALHRIYEMLTGGRPEVDLEALVAIEEKKELENKEEAWEEWMELISQAAGEGYG